MIKWKSGKKGFKVRIGGDCVGIIMFGIFLVMYL